MLRKFTITASGRILSAGVQLLTLALTARALSLKEFGEYSVTISTIFVLSAFFDFGMGSSILRGLKTVEEKRSLTTFALIRISLCCAVILLLFLSSNGTKLSLNLVLASAILAFGDTIGDLGANILLGHGRLTLASAILVSRRVFALAPLLIFSGDYSVVVSSWAGGLAGLITFILLVRQLGARPSSVKKLISSNMRFLLNSAAANLSTADTIVVSTSIGKEFAGLYSGATRFLGPLNILLTSLIQVLVPTLSAALDATQRRQAFDSVRKVTYILAVVLCLTSPLMPHVMVAVLGQKYSGAYWVAVALPVAASLSAMAQVYLAWFTATGMPLEVPKIMLASAFSGLFLVYFFSLFFGLTGAAIGLVMMQVSFYVGLATIWFMKNRGPDIN